MSLLETLAVTGFVAVVGIVALILSNRVRTVVSETLKHPLRRTEIKMDEKGKVLEIKVSDNPGFTDSATAERQPPGRD